MGDELGFDGLDELISTELEGVEVSWLLELLELTVGTVGVDDEVGVRLLDVLLLTDVEAIDVL